MAKRQTRARKIAPKETSAPQETATPQGDERPAYNPFLKADDVRTRTTLTLTGWTRRLRGKFGPQIIVEVETQDGTIYDFGISVGSPNHRMLFDALGRDETQWSGTVTVKAQRGKSANFVAILKVGTGDDARSSRSDARTPIDDDEIPF